MTDEGGVGVNVFVKNGVAIGIEIISRPHVSEGHLHRGKTKKGFFFGDSIDTMNTLYGKAYKVFGNRQFWYKKEGIIFEYLRSDSEVPDKIILNAIVIMAPDADIIPRLQWSGGL
jgi:hypothetical protein